MAAPYPQTLPQAFAQNAAAPDRNVIPNAPVTTQRASFNLGFPPLVMTPIASGGKPMLGPDMNGILYMLSTHSYYVQSGKLYLYNADVVVSIGGYAVGTLLGSADGLTVWFNITAGNTTDPDAGGAGWVAMYSYGMTPITGLIGGVRTLTPVEASKSVIVLTGALVANQQIVLPTQLRRWLIVNATTGAFNTTVKTPGAGLGVIVPQGGYAAPAEVYGDGTNIYNVVAPVNLPIDQAATPLTIVQRNNVADVFVRFVNSNGTADNAAIVNVPYDAGDGYFRKMTLANFLLQAFVNAALTGNPTAPTQPAGTNNTRIASTEFVQNATLGTAAQTWVDQTASRFLNTPYTNTTGRPIFVAFVGHCRRASAGGGAFQALCNGVIVGYLHAAGSTDMSATAGFIVPPGGIYQVSQGGGYNGYNWSELA
jgi:hypothetical protein